MSLEFVAPADFEVGDIIEVEIGGEPVTVTYIKPDFVVVHEHHRVLGIEAPDADGRRSFHLLPSAREVRRTINEIKRRRLDAVIATWAPETDNGRS
jgi:hypothetical protein